MSGHPTAYRVKGKTKHFKIGYKIGKDGCKYYRNYPDYWMDYHYEGTGPAECQNCEAYGTIEDVFVSYCSNCALYAYSYERLRPIVLDIMPDGVKFDEYDVSNSYRYEKIDKSIRSVLSRFNKEACKIFGDNRLS